jgi:hypothetical protein
MAMVSLCCPKNRIRGSMDDRDPAPVQALAVDRRVILFEIAGLGESDGRVPSPLSGAARVAAGLIE